MKLASELSQWC